MSSLKCKVKKLIYNHDISEKDGHRLIEAVDRTVPRKVLIHEESLYNGLVHKVTYMCPYCSSEIAIPNKLTIKDIFYCFQCGQKLDQGGTKI